MTYERKVMMLSTSPANHQFQANRYNEVQVDQIFNATLSFRQIACPRAGNIRGLAMTVKGSPPDSFLDAWIVHTSTSVNNCSWVSGVDPVDTPVINTATNAVTIGELVTTRFRDWAEMGVIEITMLAVIVF